MPVILDKLSAERLLVHQLRARRHSNWYPSKPKVNLGAPEIIRKFREYWGHKCSLKDLSGHLGFPTADDIRSDARFIKFLLPKDRKEMKGHG